MRNPQGLGTVARAFIPVRILLALCLASLLFCLLVPANAFAWVSISSPPNVSMSAIPGSGGTSEATCTWVAATNNLTGYTLTINADSSPAMTQTGYSIPDYATGSPQAWSVPSTGAAFGFSAEGPSTPTLTWGTPSTGAGKYRGFNGTSTIQIASKLLPALSGESTTVYFRAEIGVNYFQTSGNYTSHITATVTGLL